MKNYYEILEVDRNASQEVIEKAYKTLAKKYHPDLQEESKQQESAEKMKKINEAYEVLSNDFKRAEYDEQMLNEMSQNEAISREEQERILQENYALKQQLNNIGNNNQAMDEGTFTNITNILNEEIRNARQQAYHDAYIQDMRNRGYKIRYTHDFKYYFKLIVSILITVCVLFLVYQIPFVKNFFREMYNENIIFQSIIDAFKNTFTTTF